MKLPPDALVEWRCDRCFRLVGYVRSLDGRLRYARTVRQTARHAPDLEERDELVTPELMRDLHAHGDGVFFVSCGRHDGSIPLAGFTPTPPKRRKVVMTPVYTSG